MKDHTRRAIAYIAGRLISRESSTTVFDYSCFKYFSFVGEMNLENISVFDYENQCLIRGFGSTGSINLYHYGNKSHIYLNIEDKHFNGFDYQTGTHLSGDVDDRAIKIFDYEFDTNFNYSI
ncbi:MAG: hypothetical protein JSV21_06420 [Nitrospirota bacterium]|nr:MAG: hypothetical protein JSV21_06420 [Nitrospirota bacterium]